MLDLAQATAEINAEEWALAKLIREQSDGGDARAKRIINAYEGAIQQKAPAAEAEFLELYGGWRDEHVAAVMPIAAQLGHEPPGNGQPQSPFAVQPAPAPSQAAEAVGEVETASEPSPKAKTQPEPGNGAKTRTRRAWAQSDIAKMVRTLVLAAEADRPAVIGKLAQEIGRPVDEVTAKAVELELIPAPPSVAPYAMSDSDKTVLRKRLLEIVAPSLSVDVKLAQFKFIATEAREIIKELG
jgi:hypothetical protein